MLVKVFEAEDMPSALKKVKETLGPDALILSTRTIRKGGMGLLGKPVLEVTAAVDPQEGGAARPRTPAVAAPAPVEQDDISYEEIWKKRRVIDPLEDEIKEIKDRLNTQDLGAVKNEIDELKALIREVAARDRSTAPAARERDWGAQEQTTELAELMERLGRRGLTDEAADAILGYARKKLTPEQLRKPAVLEKFFFQVVAYLTQSCGPLLPGKGKQRRVALIGPTGVGKTTTAAKLAARYLLDYKGKVALVTIDTYRIAAVEQLKVYGEIMGLPVEVVVSPEQLLSTFERHKDKDLILIDTAGRSPRDDASLEELARFLGPQAGTENHLLLASPTRDRELHETVKRFGRLPIHSLIFTKLDECDSCGALLNIPMRQNLPISYLTNGQRVPEDLVVADAPTVARFVMGQS